MFKTKTRKWLSFVLAVIMVVGMIPQSVFSVVDLTKYNQFIKNLKVLEVYADEFAADHFGSDPGLLVLNFIRTGVDRYLDDNWETLAGPVNTDFIAYVEEQDAARNTTTMDLRDIDIEGFYLPNGNKVDFGHMFGCMNISYYKSGSADLSGWAGDLCDLLRYCAFDITVPSGTVDDMAKFIKENCFGKNASEAFGMDDFWGDMDAYYLVSEYQKNDGKVKFSALMEKYFTNELDDTVRTVYFMNNRFGVSDSRAAVRKAIFDAYSSDVGIKILESGRGLSSYNKLREACCYAIADYIYDYAQGQLVSSGSGNTDTSNPYYSVFNTQSSILAPGITQEIKYAQTADGKQIVYYVATVDVKRDDVTIMVNYKDNDPSKIGLQKVEDQVNALVNNHKNDPQYNGNFYPIVATNGDGYNISTGRPGGLVVMGGMEYFPVDRDGFFAILEDGTAMIGTQADYQANKDKIQEGIGAFGAVLIKDGEINITHNPNHTSSRASRTAIGITATGEVVMMVLDGRQEPFSAGGSMQEIAQIMKDAGCVQAVNLDGGGSTTYLSKPAGSDELQLVSRPSDGSARAVATSLVAISTAAPSTAFDHADISADYRYITAGTTMQFNVIGVSNTGNAAAIPAGSYWQVSDESIATIDANGVFTAKQNGTVDVEYIANGKSQGKITIHVVVPDGLKMETNSMTAVYGQPATLPLVATYQGNRVCVKSEDFVTVLQYSDAGTVDGFTFVPSEEAGYRTFLAGGMLLATGQIAYLVVNVYREDESVFDFNDITQGNRSFAVKREVSNTHTLDNQLYRIVDPDAPIEIDYTFALDMSTFAIPAQLEDLKGQLDNNSSGGTAWDILLSLAERVCTQTCVTIQAEFSPNLDVDISEIMLRNDLFELEYAQVDQNNVLTIRVRWINRTSYIDPSTVSSLCMLSGVKATVKDNVVFDNSELILTNNGVVTYDIYLAASSLYSFACDPANQKTYGLYPYTHDPSCRHGVENETGGYFSNTYIDFAENYVLNSDVYQGWVEDRYYVNNVPVTGVQVVPNRNDSNEIRSYEFDETGKLIGERNDINGLYTVGEKLYNLVLGKATVGWREVDGNYYYFIPGKGYAADGEYTIKEKMNPAVADGKVTTMVDYTYTFEDCILVKGQWVYDKNVTVNSTTKATGWRYRWAGKWAQAWFEVDGNQYYAQEAYPNMTITGYASVEPQDGSKSREHLLTKDEKGALMSDYTDAYEVSKGVFVFLKNGVYQNQQGAYQANSGHIYFVQGNGKLVVNTTQRINVESWGNGLLTYAKTYNFDQYGRVTEKLYTNPITNTAGAQTKIIGRVLTVTHTKAVSVFYKDDVNGDYKALDAMVNPYAGKTDYDYNYNFAIPANAVEVKIVENGDVNGDGKITKEDLTALTEYLLAIAKDENPELSTIAAFIADINGDGEITSADRVLLARALMESGHEKYEELFKELAW